ncbi:hypothetical protein GCM10010503_55540 [Streptomyces lucensis JCM 4490]|uniref:Uncharacterized protein n=1 Tax=Streptomyces lucensis JCM 4490 TaxID=1306176 RepID=A0A918MUH1_9ACTN|nr:hypothetical protein GCM10010503_55540 [Streptomyces lucensis JCM 4490]
MATAGGLSWSAPRVKKPALLAKDIRRGRLLAPSGGPRVRTVRPAGLPPRQLDERRPDFTPTGKSPRFPVSDAPARGPPYEGHVDPFQLFSSASIMSSAACPGVVPACRPARLAVPGLPS